MEEPDFPTPAFDELSTEQLARDPRACAERLRSSGRPAKLSVDGELEPVVQSLEAYRQLLGKLDSAEALVGIYRGLDEVRRGERVPLDEAFRQIRDGAAARPGKAVRE